MKHLKSYHIAWLSANINVSENQLREWLKQGFHMHHMDGNHENNDPLNLVLIWGMDHLMIHNGSKRMTYLPKIKQKNKKPEKLIKKERMRSWKCGCKLINRVFIPCKDREPLRLMLHSSILKVYTAHHPSIH